MSTSSNLIPEESAGPQGAGVGHRSDTGRTRPYYWERFDGGRLPPGEDLAALRRGIDREPGSIPAMWPFYARLQADGGVSPALRAEHLALTLFAVHQQSKNTIVHEGGVGLGSALLRLRLDGKFSEEAVDRRFAAAATATSLTELAVHLRGLITQARALDHTRLDYTQLARDLRLWQNPERVGSIRRRWGAQYFAARMVPGATDDPASHP